MLDRISHTILLSKIEHIGIRGNSYHWFETYLNERSIIIDPKLEDQFRVDFGVPQGTILGSISTTISTTNGDITCPPDRHIRFLSIFLDENHYFKHYCALVKLKLSRNLGVLQKLRHCIPGSIIKILHHSVIQPYMYCCPTLWLSTFSSFSFPVFHIHIKLVSEVTGQLIINLLNGQCTYIFLSSCFIFKYFH